MFTNPWKKPAQPTAQELIAQKMREAEIALLAAEEEFERAKHSKAMMLERVERLRAQCHNQDLPAPAIPKALHKVAA